MNVLIVGSKGFIGSHLTTYLKNKNYIVVECDVVVDYITPNYFQVDASNSDYREVFLKHQIDVCVNCSGAASVPDSFRHNFRDFTLNVSNLYRLLHTIKEIQPNTSFINLSSAAVYGNPKSLPINENEELRPISPYGLHKKQAEEICLEFYRYFEIKTISLRIFSAYGEGLRKQLFWDLFQKSKHLQTVKLLGNGQESRDFIHVFDICRAIQMVMENATFSGLKINIANGEEICIKDACNVFFKSMDSAINFEFNGKTRGGDPTNWKADIGRLKTMGYSKSISLEEGIKRYVKWIKDLP